MSSVTLIDAGTGNLRSVYKALERAGARVTITSDPAQVARGGRLVLPGVGAFGDFMHGLNERLLVEPILNAVNRGDPMLGICVGMQALFDVGEEHGSHPGLGLITGRVVSFPNIPTLKIPHTGWNQLNIVRVSPLLELISAGAYVYFNHAYYCAPSSQEQVLATTDHGIEFACAVQKGVLFGVQFHPEKSQQVGLHILKNFLNI